MSVRTWGFKSPLAHHHHYCTRYRGQPSARAPRRGRSAVRPEFSRPAPPPSTVFDQTRAVSRPNILFVTLDQFRGDCLSAAGHPVVRTPNLDRLAASGVRLGRHYSQSTPCSPGRACLYTGTYQLNNRVVSNGTPLDDRFDNVARAARRAGYEPALWGYTDQGIDPRQADGPDDPRLDTYEGILPGFDVELGLPSHHRPWRRWLEELGYEPDERRRRRSRPSPTARPSTACRPS